MSIICITCIYDWWENSIEAELRSKDGMATVAARLIALQEAGKILPSHWCHRTDRWTHCYALYRCFTGRRSLFFPDPVGTQVLRCTLADTLRQWAARDETRLFLHPTFRPRRSSHRILPFVTLLWSFDRRARQFHNRLHFENFHIKKRILSYCLHMHLNISVS